MIGEQRTQEMYPIGSLARSGAPVAAAATTSSPTSTRCTRSRRRVTRQDPYTNAGPVLNAG